MNANPRIFKDVELVREARVPIIRSIYCRFNIEVDISLHNVLVCIWNFFDELVFYY